MSLRERNARVIRMKDELIKMLDLVTRCRESVEAEVSSGIAAEMKFVDADFLKRIKELSVIFNNMTDARIRLDKAERAIENDLTPAEEYDAVRQYVRSLDPKERGQFLRTEIEWHKSNLSPNTQKQATRHGKMAAFLEETEAADEVSGE
ncbi:MAG TPA: hypothetical protein VIY48_07540 [Candidatus Paceibacterota bacterium]